MAFMSSRLHDLSGATMRERARAKRSSFTALMLRRKNSKDVPGFATLDAPPPGTHRAAPPKGSK